MQYGVEIWGWEEKKELEKVMFDYVRWIFKLDFCTPRYIISRELGMDKLKIGWGLRARKYEERITEIKEENIIRECWEEKKRNRWEDRYGKEREKYYNRNGWGIEGVEVEGIERKDMLGKLLIRERDIQSRKRRKE